MKKNLFIFLLAAMGLAGCKETGTVESAPEGAAISMEESLLNDAIVRKDISTSMVMINTILYKDSTRVGLYDTLFSLYLEMQNPYGIADVGSIILAKIRPDDLAIMEATSRALEMAGDLKPALEIERRMLQQSGDPRVRLAIATNLYNQNDVQGALNELQWILDNRAITDTIKSVQPRYERQDEVQQVPIRAVAHFMIAQVYQETNRKEAIFHANKATEIDPYFDLGAALLMELKSGRKR